MCFILLSSLILVKQEAHEKQTEAHPRIYVKGDNKNLTHLLDA